MSRPSPDEIRAALDDILPGVQKPTRYLGLERNLVRKPWDEVSVRVALAFPDAYEIGMSHQGTRILYHLVNRRSDALAERTFAPMPDMAEAMRAAGLPLFTLESYRATADFDIIGISLQSELNYINIPYLLDLSGITRRAADRGQDSAAGRAPPTRSRLPTSLTPFSSATARRRSTRFSMRFATGGRRATIGCRCFAVWLRSAASMSRPSTAGTLAPPGRTRGGRRSMMRRRFRWRGCGSRNSIRPTSPSR